MRGNYHPWVGQNASLLPPGNFVADIPNSDAAFRANLFGTFRIPFSNNERYGCETPSFTAACSCVQSFCSTSRKCGGQRTQKMSPIRHSTRCKSMKIDVKE